MNKKNQKTALLFFLFFLLSSLAYSDTSTISDIKIEKKDSHLLISAALKSGFNEKITEAIKSGLSITLKYYIELKKARTLWFDKNVTTKEIIKTVKYDNLEKEYYFTSIEGNSNITKNTKKYDELQHWMTNLSGVEIKPFFPIQKNEKLYVRIKAEMPAKKLWFPLNYILFFMDKKDVSTPWALSEDFQLPYEL